MVDESSKPKQFVYVTEGTKNTEIKLDNTRDDKSDKITLRWLHENVPMSWWFWILGIVVVVYSSGVTFSKWDKIQHWFNPNDKELVKTIELTSKPTTEFITSTDRSINNELLTLNQEYNKLTSNYESQIKEQGKLEEKLETLGNENYALTKKLSNLGRKHNELTSNYELQIKEQGKLEGRLEALRKENRLLIVEINGLKNRLESKNISIPKSFEEEDLHKKKNSANDIIQSLSGMYSSHVANF